jgi:hypothetical protein
MQAMDAASSSPSPGQQPAGAGAGPQGLLPAAVAGPAAAPTPPPAAAQLPGGPLGGGAGPLEADVQRLEAFLTMEDFGGSEDGRSHRSAGSTYMDWNTQAVVALTALLEGVVERLLSAALQQAASTSSSGALASANAGLVEVGARQVMLAAHADPLLSALLLKPGGATTVGGVVAGAGVVPGVPAALLPDARREPLAAVLFEAGRRPGCIGGGAGSGGSSGAGAAPARLMHPLDLHYHCGSEAGAAGSSRCCFLAGVQCGTCAQLQQAAPQDPEARLALCAQGWQAALAQPPAAGVQPSAARELLAANGGALLHQLLAAVRVYSCRQDWWAEAPQDLQPDQAAALAAAAPALQQLADVAALRDIQQQQAAAGCAASTSEFTAAAMQAYDAVLQQRRQQQRAEAALGPDAASGQGAAAAAGAGAAPGADAEEEPQLSPEALQALQAAAEQLVVEQLSLAQEGALMSGGHAAVTPANLRWALRVSGLQRLLSEPGGEQDAGLLDTLL